MEMKDEELIASLLEREPELRRYYEEHNDLKRQLPAAETLSHPGRRGREETTAEAQARREGQDHGDPLPPPRSLSARESMRHTISILVENEFGVLARVAGMFSGRGYNIARQQAGRLAHR